MRLTLSEPRFPRASWENTYHLGLSGETEREGRNKEMCRLRVSVPSRCLLPAVRQRHSQGPPPHTPSAKGLFSSFQQRFRDVQLSQRHTAGKPGLEPRPSVCWARAPSIILSSHLVHRTSSHNRPWNSSPHPPHSAPPPLSTWPGESSLEPAATRTLSKNPQAQAEGKRGTVNI